VIHPKARARFTSAALVVVTLTVTLLVGQEVWQIQAQQMGRHETIHFGAPLMTLADLGVIAGLVVLAAFVISVPSRLGLPDDDKEGDDS